MIVETSYTFLDMTGYSREDILFKTLSDICIKLLKMNLNLDDLESIVDRKCCYLFTKTNQARLVDLSINPGHGSSELVCLFLERPGSRFEEKNMHLEQLCRDNHYGIAVYTIPDFILLKANQKFADTLDKPYEKVENAVGKHIGDMTDWWKDGGTEKDTWMWAVETGKPYYEREFIHKTKSGDESYWDMTIVPLYEGGTPRYMAIMLNDVTDIVMERKRTGTRIDDAYRESDKKVSFARDEFLYAVSHELKTPLTVISSAIQAMELVCRNEISGKAREYIGKIRQNTFRLIRLVNSLLELTRIESGYSKVQLWNMDIVFMTRAVTESVLVYARQKGVNLEFSSHLKKRIIAMDDEKYERILLNLLSNAIKFTQKDKSIFVTVSSTGGMVYIRVKDEGVGIPKDKQELIFERYRQVDNDLTRSDEGFGIGLSLVKKLVNILGGSITVESEEGKGSTFTVAFRDVKTNEYIRDKTVQKKNADNENSRLINAVSVEFSDIYLT